MAAAISIFLAVELTAVSSEPAETANTLQGTQAERRQHRQQGNKAAHQFETHGHTPPVHSDDPLPGHIGGDRGQL
jgi:hypothetical protein